MYHNPRKESLKPQYKCDYQIPDLPPPPRSIHRVRSSERKRLLNGANARISEASEALIESARLFNDVRNFARRNGMQLHVDLLLDVMAAISCLEALVARLREQFECWEHSIGAEIAPEIEEEIEAIRRKITRGAQ